MKDYKSLTRDEKIAKALPYRVTRRYRNIKARYLLALRNNDKSMLEYFERMGDSLRVIIENTTSFERAKECGFTEPQFDKYGWCRYELEIIKETHIGISSIKIAITPSGKYVCGGDFRTSIGCGCMSGPSIWGMLYDTEREAEQVALNRLKEQMMRGIEAEKTDSCGNYNLKIINDTLREIDRLRKPVQLELF